MEQRLCLRKTVQFWGNGGSNRSLNNISRQVVSAGTTGVTQRHESSVPNWSISVIDKEGGRGRSVW